jgi:hypothetical protein
MDFYSQLIKEVITQQRAENFSRCFHGISHESQSKTDPQVLRTTGIGNTDSTDGHSFSSNISNR